MNADFLRVAGGWGVCAGEGPCSCEYGWHLTVVLGLESRRISLFYDMSVLREEECRG